MATKQFYATGDFRYGTRMLRAGDPVELDAAHARLFTALNKISPNKPKGALPAVAKIAEDEKVTVAPKAKRKDAVPAMSTKNTGRKKAK